MKRYSNGAGVGADNHKDLFLEESISFVKAGGPVLNEMETE
jgi:hypothetical protein